jgi:hypothetical protein
MLKFIPVRVGINWPFLKRTFQIYLPIFLLRLLCRCNTINKDTMEEKLSIFFDLDKPCPPDINNCEDLRKQYTAELKKYQESNACTSCVMRTLRNKYLTFLMATNPEIG